jgi:hypothetical protein
MDKCACVCFSYVIELKSNYFIIRTNKVYVPLVTCITTRHCDAMYTAGLAVFAVIEI